MSTAKTMTLRKISELEVELETARRERESIEANIYAMKTSLASPSSPLSPMASRRIC